MCEWAAYSHKQGQFASKREEPTQRSAQAIKNCCRDNIIQVGHAAMRARASSWKLGRANACPQLNDDPVKHVAQLRDETGRS